MSRAAPLRPMMFIAGTAKLILPILITWGLWQEPFTLQGFLFALVISLFLVFLGRWDLVGVPLRYVFVAALLFIAYDKGGPRPCILTLVLLAALSLLFRHHGDGSIDMQFPLGPGTYYVVQGGQSSWLNHHHPSRSQKFALDIVALNRWGIRARGIYPRQLEAYCIFGDSVYSPCSGTITATKGDLADVLPGQADEKHVTGNHIVIRHDGTDIYVGLCHLMKDTILVRAGEHVETMQRLARVGNSGNTSEPHLHVHAKRGGVAESMLDGEAVTVCFKSRWLIRGDVLRSTYRG